MSDKYNDLIFNYDLYAPSFVEFYGIKSVHWNNSNSQQRERSLRHDKVCLLLCNSQLMDEPQPGSSGKGKEYSKQFEAAGGFGGDLAELMEIAASEDIEVHEEEGVTYDDESEYEDYMDQEDINVIRPEKAPERFVLLEGNAAASRYQNYYANMWGCALPPSKWDIIDRQEKRFIEVKVTSCYSEAVDDFEAKRSGLVSYTSLCWINPETADIVWLDHDGGLSGEAKVRDFLLERKRLMNLHGILESEQQTALSIHEETFRSNYFKGLAKQWGDYIWEMRRNPVMSQEIRPEETPSAVTVKELLFGIEDPSKRKEDAVTWPGKILPEPFIQNIRIESDTDTDMVKKFFEFCGEAESGDEKGIELYREVLQLVQEPTFYSHKLKALSGKNKEATRLEKAVGITMKKTIYNPSADDVKQKENIPIQKAAYHPWFEEMMWDLAMDTGEENVMCFEHLLKDELNEEEIEHQMGRVAKESFDEILDVFSRGMISKYASKIVNVYSRFGSAYLVRNNSSSTNKNVVCFPIYATLRNSEGAVVARELSGVIVRGPHHAKQVTDKINFLTIELLGESNKSLAYQEFIKKPMVIRMTNGSRVCLKENAIEKGDASYLTFLLDSLFTVSNLIGEIAIQEAAKHSHSDLRQIISTIIDRNSIWVRERIVESIMMATIGRSQEEGALAQLRKLLMILVAKSRPGHVAACWSTEGFCEKLNECVIDRPLAMHFTKSFLMVMEKWQTFYDERSGAIKN